MRPLIAVSGLGIQLLKGLLRIGVVVFVYVLSAFAGVAIEIPSASWGAQSLVVGAGLGGLLPSVAVTVGFAGCLIPATIRIYAAGGNPDVDYALPKPIDSVLFVAITVMISGWAALWLHFLVFGFVFLEIVLTAIIVAAGGAKVAELWGNIVTATLELIAGG